MVAKIYAEHAYLFILLCCECFTIHLNNNQNFEKKEIDCQILV